MSKQSKTTNPKKPPILVAEMSANHNQNLMLALKTIEAAKQSGADFIKLQTYTPDCLTIDSDAKSFKISGGTLWDGENLYSLYKRACMPMQWHNELFSYAREIGINIFSSAFSAKGLELLETLGCPMYKIASFEITDLELIKLVSSTKKPLVLSTGIATPNEIQDALDVARKAGAKDITLLLCLSAYPAPIESMNLLSMKGLGDYGVKVGLSDHSIGDTCAIVATALGASLIEKHFILDKTLGGVDSTFSMDKDEFRLMRERVNKAFLSLGSEDFKGGSNNLEQRQFARSLFVCNDIKKGEILTRENVRCIRPNNGLPPKLLPNILGKKATKDLPRGKPLEMQDFTI